MAICITGMHRSNTSVFSRMLGASCVDLDDESQHLPPVPDNPDGFGEHIKFYEINEDLLGALRSSWHSPPPPLTACSTDFRLAGLRIKAQEMLTQLPMRDPWGWKDPRNCLTLPFWRGIVSISKVAVMVRHPVEVAKSLVERNSPAMSISQALELCLIYNQRLLNSTEEGERVVCHAERLFLDPERELRRAVSRLGLESTDEKIAAAVSLYKRELRTHVEPAGSMIGLAGTPGLAEAYQRLCIEADLAI